MDILPQFVAMAESTNDRNPIMRAGSTSRLTFHAKGRWWVLHRDLETLLLWSSPDRGETWDGPVLLTENSGTEGFSLWYDQKRDYVHYCSTFERDPIYYGMFRPNADGSITFAGNEQVAVPYYDGRRCYGANISVDTAGYPFITWNWEGPGFNSPYVVKSKYNDGRFVPDAGFPMRLCFDDVCNRPIPLQLLNRKMLFVWLEVGGRAGMHCRLWTGISWEPQEWVSRAVASLGFELFSAVAVGDTAHVVWQTNDAIVHNAWDYVLGWEADYWTLYSRSERPWLSVCPDTGDLICFWADAPLDNRLYFARYHDRVWSNLIEWFREAEEFCGQYETIVMPGYEAQNGLIPIVYATRWYSPFPIKFAALDVSLPAETYTLTISVSGNGTTEPIPGSWEYPAGEIVNVTAIPDAGWRFVGWTGDIISGDNPLTLEMSRDMSIAAVFEEVVTTDHSVTIQVVGSGTTNPPPGDYIFADGYNLTILAMPDEGWEFERWATDLSGTDNPTTVVVDRDLSITAIFRSVTPIGPYASIMGITAPESAREGDTVVIHTIIRNNGDAWGTLRARGISGEVSMTIDPPSQDLDPRVEAPFSLTFIMPATNVQFEIAGEHWDPDMLGWIQDEVSTPRTVELETVVETHTVVIEVVGNGTTNPAPGTYVLDHGYELSILAIPGAGWGFEGWSGDISGTENPITVPVNRNLSIVAVFREIVPTYLLTIGVIGEGSTEPPPGTYEYDSGQEVTVTAIPDVDNRFLQWQGDVSGTENPVTFVVDRDMNITAVFESLAGPVAHIVDLNIPASALEGERVTIEVTLRNDGELWGSFKVHDILGEVEIGDTVGDLDPGDQMPFYLEFTMPARDISLQLSAGHWDPDTAAWIEDEVSAPYKVELHCLLTIIVAGDGSTDPAAGTYEYDSGQEVTVTAIPVAGSEFLRWEGDITGTENPIAVTITRDMAITAVFMFVSVTHILTIETDGQGTTDPAPGAWEYEEGAAVTVNAIPDAGWQFDHWEGDISGTDNPVEFIITSDMGIVAVFTEVVVPPEECAVSISVMGQGITDPPPGTYTVDKGTILTITAYPAEGWQFDHWEGDISGTMNPANIEVLTDISVVAVFVEEVVPPPKPQWILPAAIAAGAAFLGIIVTRGRGNR